MKLFQTGVQWSLGELKGEGRNVLRSAPQTSLCAWTAAVATSIVKTMERAPRTCLGIAIAMGVKVELGMASG